MAAPTGRASARSDNHWAELDVLRALAGALMVANHAGVSWLPPGRPASALARAVIFAGGLAPVLFFTVTGLGRGVQGAASASAPRPLADTLRRVLVLFLADAGIWLAPGAHLGMDFLGFIGLSTLVLELVNRSRRPGFNAALGAAACFGLRFAVAPRFGHATALARALSYATGEGTWPGISYMPVPWLGYPLLGLALGRFAAAHAERLRASRARNAWLLGAAAAVGLVLCALLARRGLVFFRWGSISFAYGVFSLAGLTAALALTLVVVQRGSAAAVAAVSLPGLASFVIVPVHYLGVMLCQQLAPGAVGATFPLGLVVLVPLVFAASKGLDRRITRLARRPTSALGWSVLLGGIVALLACVAFVPVVDATGEMRPARVLLMASLQLLACVLFALTSRRRAVSPSALPVAVATPLAPGA